MPGQSFSFNAYEASLASLLSAESTTIALDSVAGLGTNGYLVIDPASPSLREYIYYTSINGLNLEGCLRGLAGSIIQGFGVAHDAGIKVRAVPVHQHLDDIWGDDGIKGVVDDLTTHEGDANPHTNAGFLQQNDADTLYLKVDGSKAMEADLPMGGTNQVKNMANGTDDQDAATLKQVTDSDNAVRSDFAAADGVVDAANVSKTGDSMSGQLDMGGNRIVNGAPGSSENDFATMAQLGSVDAPSHDATSGITADNHHTRYTNAEAVAAVGPHFSGSHSALSGISASQHHTRYSDDEARAAGTNFFAPVSNPNFAGTVRINGFQTLTLVGPYTKLQANGTDIISGDASDELYVSGVPYSNAQYGMRCADTGGGGRRVYYFDDSSTERNKHDIKLSDHVGGECLTWDMYEFRKNLEGDEGKVHLWTVAERIQEQSGDQFVVRDDEGAVQNTDDRAMMADMILTIQALAKRIEELEAR